MQEVTQDSTARAIADAVDTPACVVTSEGACEHANAALRALIGVDPAGHGWLAALRAGEASADPAFWRAKLGARETFAFDVPASKARENVHVTAVTVDGEWLVTLAFRRNEETARARADELDVILDMIPAAVWIANDRECRSLRSSMKGYELLRVPHGGEVSKTAATAPPQHFTVYQHGVELAPTELPLQVAAREGVELRDFEEEVRFADGDSVFIYGSAVPLRAEDGTPRGAIAAFIDITRLKHAEAALREADQRKDAFIATLSHELRNPLAPIVTAVHLMKQRGQVATPQEIAIIERQALHLMRLVDDLLDVARIVQGKIELTRSPVELATLVAHAVETTRPMFHQKQHELVVDVPTTGFVVDGDHARLVQVVSNLLTNAARYTPSRGHVHVSAAREAGAIVLRVKDDGIGITPELLPTIFGLFVQGRRPIEHGGGLGLGLALVQRLVELHGGTVEARSAGAGRGSEFVVRIPSTERGAAVDSDADEVSWASVDRTGRRVLVVDDNADAAEMLELLLANAGHTVRVANDPIDALAMLDEFTPELAVLDLGMPKMPGDELGAEIRRRLGSRAPLLVALSGYGQESDRERTARAGFVAHLVKPVEPDRLVNLIDALLDPARGQRKH